jgi:hypothetical protein
MTKGKQMKSILLASLFALVSLTAFAGRETHGVLPGAQGFVCTSEDTSNTTQVELTMEGRKVTAATVTNGGQMVAELTCKDRFEKINLSESPQLTVVCTDNKTPGYRLQLRESLTNAQVTILKTDSLPYSKPVQTLPCQ